MVKWLFPQQGGWTDPVSKRNFYANVFDGAFYGLGLSFASQQTVLPVFVSHAGGSNFLLGLIPVLWTVGSNFPQIFIAPVVERLSYKRPLFTRTALFQRLPFLLLAVITVLLVGRVPQQTSLMLFFAVFVLVVLANSINMPIWFDLIAKLTPVRLRGRLFGFRNILSGVLGVLGGVVVNRVLSAVAFPMNFAILFFLAWMAMMASFMFLSRLTGEKPSVPKPQINRTEYLRMLPKILRTQNNFRNILVADGLFLTATMASAFYIVNGIQKFHLSDAYAGTCTIIIMSSMIIGNLFFGAFADRYGHRLNLLLAAGSAALACIAALLAPSPAMYLFVFVGSALATGLSGISRLSIVAEICSEEERPTYMALMNLVTSPFVLLGIGGGWIAEQFGFNAVFIIGAALASAAALWITLMVREPRFLKERPLVQGMQYES